jgi:hypothetical protein
MNDMNRVVIRTFAICIIVGSLIGCILFGIFVQGIPLFFLARDIAGVPVLLYAFISGAPIGALAGAIATALGFFVKKRVPNLQLSGWLAVGSAAGFIFGFLYALVAFITTFDVSAFTRTLLVLGSTGLICGLLVGAVWGPQASRIA